MIRTPKASPKQIGRRLSKSRSWSSELIDDFATKLTDQTLSDTNEILSKMSIRPISKPAPDHSLLNVPIMDAIPRHPFIFVEDTDTIMQIIERLTLEKMCFAVIRKGGRPSGTIDTVDIAAYCNKIIIQSPHRTFEDLASQLEQLRQLFLKATLSEVFPENEAQNISISSSKSLQHLVHVMCSIPSLKRLPIMENEEVLTACAPEDVLRFILSYPKCSNILKQPVADIQFQRNGSKYITSEEEVMNYAFKKMWEKQMDGVLACSNRSSPLDIFINLLNYVHSSVSLFSHETSQIQSKVTIEVTLEHLLREQVHYLQVTDCQRRILGVLTVTDLLAFFAT